MQHSLQIDQKALASDLIKEAERLSDTEPTSCMQCGMCTGGCPLAYEMDWSPRQILRLLQLGLVNDALSSRTIWLCLTCETCTARCPRDIDLAKLMSSLREIAITQKIKPAEKDILSFHRSFLELVKRGGRLFELGLVGLYKLRSRHLFQDVLLAPVMLRKGKLKLIPRRIKGQDKVARIFAKIEKQ
ncbi:MAG: 4Fe-4S dicluster domain-containing protein [Deltaproteobacteria bacterium]|nr:MAG: 4Fe-4S dicluster domain-containing protein [Deltaproteobacteria bacterium]